MNEAPYDSERLLQELLAHHPDLLAGEQINRDEPRRWLLVTREVAVQSNDDSSPRWYLDHLFLDQDGIPTLVEVKKGSNTDLRRKVIGQMLDYAANAVAYWSIEDLRVRFENRCEQRQLDAEEELAALLGQRGSADEYWQSVKTNLQAGRIRIVFLADSIPVELRRVVEFLNEQMDPAEVLAIEIKQFVGAGMRTLVPRVLGQTEVAIQRKSAGLSRAREWDEERFMVAIEESSGSESRRVAQEILHWISPQVTKIWWGTGSKEGGIIPIIIHNKTTYHICRLASQGWIAFRLDWLSKKPPFDQEAARWQLLAHLNQISPHQFGERSLNGRARIPLRDLQTPESVEKLKSALSWLITQVNAEIPKGG